MTTYRPISYTYIHVQPQDLTLTTTLPFNYRMGFVIPDIREYRAPNISWIFDASLRLVATSLLLLWSRLDSCYARITRPSYPPLLMRRWQTICGKGEYYITVLYRWHTLKLKLMSIIYNIITASAQRRWTQGKTVLQIRIVSWPFTDYDYKRNTSRYAS